MVQWLRWAPPVTNVAAMIGLTESRVQVLRTAKQAFLQEKENEMSAQMLKMSLRLGVGTVLRLERDAWSMMLK